MTDKQMWLEGNEDGDVQLVCGRDACMVDGPKTNWNPRGRYYRGYSVGYRPDFMDVTLAWVEHLKKHEAADE